MTAPRIGSDPRAGLAVVVGGVALAASYIALRLWQAAGDEVDPRIVLAQARVPFSWRIFVAIVQAATAASLAALIPAAHAERILAQGWWAIPLIAALLTLAALAVP